MTRPGEPVTSEGIDCHTIVPCFKIECQAPLPEPVVNHTYHERTGTPITEMIEYERGPVIHVCRLCLAQDRGMVASYFMSVIEGARRAG